MGSGEYEGYKTPQDLMRDQHARALASKGRRIYLPTYLSTYPLKTLAASHRRPSPLATCGSLGNRGVGLRRRLKNEAKLVASGAASHSCASLNENHDIVVYEHLWLIRKTGVWAATSMLKWSKMDSRIFSKSMKCKPKWRSKFIKINQQIDQKSMEMMPVWGRKSMQNWWKIDQKTDQK